MTHTTTVAHATSVGRGAGIDLYQATCTCGWTSTVVRQGGAEHQATEHKATS